MHKKSFMRQKPGMILVDFDGVVSRNGVKIIFDFFYRFVNRYTPFPQEALMDFFKATISYPTSKTIPLFFTSLGIENRMKQFSEELMQLTEFENRIITIEKDFFHFLDICDTEKIPYRIFSAAANNAKRLTGLFERIKKEYIFNLEERPKSDIKTFIYASEKLGIDPDKCVLIDDSPIALRSAHIAGMTTVMMYNNIFNHKDYIPFRMYINHTIKSFREAEKIIKKLL